MAHHAHPGEKATAASPPLVASLGQIPYFGGLDAAAIADIARAVRQRAVGSGEIILTEGDPCLGLYFVIAGQVRLTKTAADRRAHVLRVLGPGATFNDVAVFDGGPNSDSAVAVGPTRVGYVPTATMVRLIERHPGIARAALKLLSRRQRSLGAVVGDLALPASPTGRSPPWSARCARWCSARSRSWSATAPLHSPAAASTFATRQSLRNGRTAQKSENARAFIFDRENIMFCLCSPTGAMEERKMSKSSTTTTERLPNPTPGEILLQEFLAPMGLSQTALARALGVPPRRINEIVLGKRAVTADTDLRLARYFGVSDGFFLQLQADHDLMARRREIGGVLKAIKPRTKAA
jgi:addiction module HigA family antidote